MVLIFTPGQFARRAEFYHQLAQVTAAGIGLVGALEHLARHPPAASYREPLQELLRHLAEGYTLTESLQRTGDWLPAFDVALLQAGELSGRLDSCFRLLANYYDDRARTARQIIGDLIYPVLLLHLAVFLLPFAQFFVSGNWLGYAGHTLGVLIPIYLVAGLLIYVSQARHGETWRAWVEALIRPVPVLGTARHCLALGRLATALEGLLSAGVTIVEAWELAASASGSPALRRAVVGWRPLINAGQTPGEVVRGSREFPELFADQYATGEVSGKLDETLRRLHGYYEEEGRRKLHAVAQWTPRAAYCVIALVIAYRVLVFWTGYFKQIQDAGGF